MYSDSNRLVLSIFRQIESAILLIRDWNAGRSSAIYIPTDTMNCKTK